MFDTYFRDIQHRGGWKDVIIDLKNNDFFNNNSNLIFFDTIEYYFLFRSDYICKNKWMGIVHFTPISAPYCYEQNIHRLFENNNFIVSLKNCICLFTLSSYIREFLVKKLKAFNYNIKVIVLKHPIKDNSVLQFDINNYINSKKKKLLQIGQQTRKISDFFFLKNNHYKIWLTGNKNMEECKTILDRELNYFKINRSLLNKNVLIYYTKTYNEYDNLLSRGIVFINLIDCGANNTVIECIIRNTPIIVNKIPGVIEYLGIDYPLYYNDISEVDALVNNINKIKDAHLYLKNMNKSDLSLDYFKSNLYKEIHNCFQFFKDYEDAEETKEDIIETKEDKEEYNLSTSINSNTIEIVETNKEIKTIIFTNAREEKNILEWVIHHINMGFNHIYINDHKSIIPISNILKNIPSHLITVNEINTNTIDKANLYYYANTFAKKNNYNWMLYLDADEFLVLNNDNCIDTFLKKYEIYDQIVLNWLLFGSNSLDSENDNTILENYTKCENRLDRHTKTFLHISDKEIVIKNPHIYILENMSKSVTSDFEPLNIDEPWFFENKKKFFEVPAYVAHYYYQNYETYTKRKIMLPRDDNNEYREKITREVFHTHYNDEINLYPMLKYNLKNKQLMNMYKN
jgi:hypothetical protein